MANLPADSVFMRLGKNSDVTSRTGTPSTWLNVPIDSNGLNAIGNSQTQDLDTEHHLPGVLYSLFTQRNSGEGTLTTKLWPEQIGTLLKLPFTINGTTNIPEYFGIQQFILNSGGTAAATGGSITGSQLYGCLGQSAQLTVDKAQGGPLTLQLGFLLNRDSSIATTGIVPTFPTGRPLTGANTYVDVAYTDGAGDFATPKWSGNASGLRTVTISYQNQIEVDNYSANSNADLNQTWTEATKGTPTLEITVDTKVNADVHLDLHRGTEQRAIGLRIMGHDSNPSGSTTSAGTYTTSDDTITVASATGFAVGDICVLNDGTKQQVLEIDSIATNDITFTTNLLIAMDGSSTAFSVVNTGFEIRVDRADIVSAQNHQKNGNVRTKQFTARARLESGQTSIASVQAYNDDGS